MNMSYYERSKVRHVNGKVGKTNKKSITYDYNVSCQAGERYGL